MSGTFTAVIFTVIGIVFKIVFDWVYRITNETFNPQEMGYTKVSLRGDCKDEITITPHETIIRLEIDWERYGQHKQEVEAMERLISIAWGGENITPLKYLKHRDEEYTENLKIWRDYELKEQALQNQLKEVEDERDAIRSKFDRLKTAIDDALIDSNEPPF